MDTANRSLTKKLAPHSQSLKAIYLLCTALSILISWGIFSQFFLAGNASIAAFFQQAFQTPVATLVSSDVLISFIIFIIFAYAELSRLNMPSHRLLLYVVVGSSVGVCCALSLFLYQREAWLLDTQGA